MPDADALSVLSALVWDAMATASAERSTSGSSDNIGTSDDEESGDEKEETTSMPSLTIAERGILSTVKLTKTGKAPLEDSIEDRLYLSNPLPTPEAYLNEASMKPLYSYLGNMSLETVYVNKLHMTEQKGIKMALKVEHEKKLTELSTRCAHCNHHLSEANRRVAELEQLLASERQKAVVLQGRSSRLEEAMVGYRNEITAINKDVGVFDVMMPAFEVLVTLHENENLSRKLPYSCVSTDADVKNLAEHNYGVSSYEIAKSHAHKKHVHIARSLTLFGFMKSPAANLLGQLKASNEPNKQEMVEQTCTAFRLAMPKTAESPDKKRKRLKSFSSDKKRSAKKRRSTTDDDETKRMLGVLLTSLQQVSNGQSSNGGVASSDLDKKAPPASAPAPK